MSTGLFLAVVVLWCACAIAFEVYVYLVHRLDLTISRLSRRYVVLRVAMLLAFLVFAGWWWLHSSPSCPARYHLWVHCA